jgi:hypothetical protein
MISRGVSLGETLGEKDELVACGTDDGHVFIYRADTGEFLFVTA